jgi:hypothetical protein
MKIRECGDFDIITKKPKLELVSDSGETLATATIDVVINPWVPILKTAPHDRLLRRHTRHGDMLAIIHANEDCGTLLIDGLDAGALIYNDAACQFRFVASGKIAAAPEVLRAMLTVLEEFFEMLESPEFGQTPPMEPTP